MHIRCRGESNGGAKISVLGGSGSYTYVWKTSVGVIIGGNSSEINSLPAATYYVKATDTENTNLVDSTSVTINDPPSTMVAAFDSTKHISCYGDSDGYLRVVVTGGWGDYKYIWTPSGTTDKYANNLEPGEHTVTITDAGGCEKLLSREIEEPEELVVNIVSEEPISCNGLADGALEAEADGGIPGYAYVWDDPGQSLPQSISRRWVI